MELGATMELAGGRGGQLEVGDTPSIVMEKIQPLSTCSACDMRYYHSRSAVLPQGHAVLPWGTTVLPRQLQRLYHRQSYRERGTTAPTCGTTARQESLGLGRARMK